MGKSGFRLGMGQMLVEGAKVDSNLGRAVKMLEDAADRGCHIVVLPECLDVGWTHPQARELARPIPGEYSSVLCSAAKRCGIHVVAGLTEKSGERIYNSAVLISPEGDILLKHRKINELDIAQDLYSIGNTLSVAETSLGVIGIDICADNFPDSLVLGHSLARMGAQIILSPSAWAVEPWHDNSRESCTDIWKKSYSRLAKLYSISVVGVSNVGPIEAGVWKGKVCIGGSLAVGPDGKIIAEGPYGEFAEKLVVVEIGLLPREEKGTRISEMLCKKGRGWPNEE